MAPDHRQLHNMSQNERESFKEYAQCWREMAYQVEQPLVEKKAHMHVYGYLVSFLLGEDDW